MCVLFLHAFLSLSSLPLHPPFPPSSVRPSSPTTEYIVTFTSYYTTEARDGYLSAALHSFKGWAIVPRSNPSQSYPSDFSLLQLSGDTGDSDAILQALQHHPLIKRVTPQRRLTRVLTFAQDGEWNTSYQPLDLAFVCCFHSLLPLSPLSLPPIPPPFLLPSLPLPTPLFTINKPSCSYSSPPTEPTATGCARGHSCQWETDWKSRYMHTYTVQTSEHVHMQCIHIHVHVIIVT